MSSGVSAVLVSRVLELLLPVMMIVVVVEYAEFRHPRLWISVRMSSEDAISLDPERHARLVLVFSTNTLLSSSG